jgi:serine/threonine-protein kinase mTOR
VGESYSRAYPDIVRAQQCAELSEVIQYLKLAAITADRGVDDEEEDSVDPELASRREARLGAVGRQRVIREVWHARLLGVEQSVDVWTGLLAVRRLVLSPTEDLGVYLKYASMCRKEGKEQQAWRTLTKLLGYNPMNLQRGQPGYGAQSSNPLVRFCRIDSKPPKRVYTAGNMGLSVPCIMVCCLLSHPATARHKWPHSSGANHFSNLLVALQQRHHRV